MRQSLAIGVSACCLTLVSQPTLSRETPPLVQQKNPSPSPTDLQEAEVYNNLGVDWASQGRFIEAIAAFQRAIELYPNYENAYNNLGIAYASLGDFSAAVDAFQSAIEINPRNWETHNNLGSAFGSLGQFPEAADAFQEAIFLNPNIPDCHYNFALALLNQGKISEAIAPLKKARTLYLQLDNRRAVDEINRLLQRIENQQF